MDSQAPETKTFPPPIPPMNSAETPNPQRGSALRHLAILSGLLAPIAFLPWFLTRRQVTVLRRRVDEMGAIVARLKQRQPAAIAVDAEAGTPSLIEMQQQLDSLRAQVEHNDAERSKALSDLTMDMININEELDQIRGDITRAAQGPIAPLEQQISREEVRAMLKDNITALRQDTASSKAAVDEQLRQLRGEQDALRSELFKMADRWQTTQTGPSAMNSAELHRLLQETRQTRYVR